mgnify:CR=1 FL=1
MADDGIYTKNADIQALAGINAGATAKLTATTDVYVLQVEAMFHLLTGYNWGAAVTDGTILDSLLKAALTQWTAAECARRVVNADPTGYSARERETTLDFLGSLKQEAVDVIKTDDATAMLKDEGNGI